MPSVQGFHQEFNGIEADVIGVAISAPEPEVRALMDKQGLTFPVAYDPAGQLSGVYGVSGVPFYIFIDKAGRIAHTIPGAPSDVNTIRDLIQGLQAE